MFNQTTSNATAADGSNVSSPPKRQLKSPSPYPCEKAQLHTPPLEEVARVLDAGLKQHFAHASAQVVECPDLTQKPFNVIRPGLSGGQQALLDVGGPAYIIPKPQLERTYDLRAIADQLHLNEHAIIGAGAGPYHHYGHNSELVANMFASGAAGSNEARGCCETESRCIMVITPATNEIAANTGNSANNNTTQMHILQDGNNQQQNDKCCEFSILGNFYASRGEPGPVICINARHRTSEAAKDFTECIRSILSKHYGEQPVALGGTFAVHKGRVRVHVMPDFPRDSLQTEDALNKWLQFYTVDAPLSFHGEIVSHDPGFDLRTKHAHGYGPNGGGHYHNDESPDEVEYEAYYNVAKVLYRIDRPDKASAAAADFGHD